ncbi:hypothetical protein [Dactylosporangium sp. CA-092794]|uniref:hypothetical protein n=1 Tax=Dactylosporangium sp. CA-092794 TaxID=3239929 RepID=UPI003D93AA78
MFATGDGAAGLMAVDAVTASTEMNDDAIGGCRLPRSREASHSMIIDAASPASFASAAANHASNPLVKGFPPAYAMALTMTHLATRNQLNSCSENLRVPTCGSTGLDRLS